MRNGSLTGAAHAGQPFAALAARVARIVCTLVGALAVPMLAAASAAPMMPEFNAESNIASITSVGLPPDAEGVLELLLLKMLMPTPTTAEICGQSGFTFEPGLTSVMVSA